MAAEVKEAESKDSEAKEAEAKPPSKAELAAALKSTMKTVFPGDDKNFPTVKDIIRVHYTARIIGMTELLESSRARGAAFEFSLGRGEVVKGWEECLPLMSVGQHCMINCPPEMCYGEEGIPPVIPPNASFEFDIQLISIRPIPTKTSYELRIYQEGDDPEDANYVDPDAPTPSSAVSGSSDESSDSDPDSDDEDDLGADSPKAAGTGKGGPSYLEAKEEEEETEDSDSFEGVGDEDMDVSKYIFKD